jgi:hypothetical protein
VDYVVAGDIVVKSFREYAALLEKRSLSTGGDYCKRNGSGQSVVPHGAEPWDAK